MSTTTTTIPVIPIERPGRVRRWNAWFFDTFDELIDRRLRADKAELFRDLSGTIVEIGAGTGANLRYLPVGTTVIAVEPSVAMHDRFLARAERLGIDASLDPTSAQRLPFPDASVDVVVSTLTLCTVPDPVAALAEIHRVLRPGGRFVFLEHVIAPRRGLLRAVQRAVRRPWSWVFDGCDTCRTTEATIRDVSWREVHIERRRPLDLLFFPVSQRIHGTVTR
jgi:SAM-dependent methyltransferase